MIKSLRLAWYWLRSRYAVPNAYVRCETCPNWIFHSHVKTERAVNLPDSAFAPLELDFQAGICALDRPKVFNDYTTGFAFKAWIGDDWCPRHPLYDPKIVQCSDLQYRPGEDATLANGGFDRLPTFQEAVAMAMKSSTIDKVSDQALFIAPDKAQEHVPAPDNDHAR